MSRFTRLALLILALAVSSLTIAGERLSKLDILEKGYPRAFFFRQTEGFARAARLTFEEWEQTFLPLNGIMGKALDEEVPGTSPNCIAYFTRYKSLHPEKAVLLHFNGNSRDPRFDAGDFFAGHWTYFNGCGLTKDLPAEEGESIVHVEDTTLFKTQMGRYGDKNEDIGICALDADGRPNWAIAEQVELLEVDARKRTLKVRRAAFGTKPLAFQSGKSYIAAHATEGPWGKRSNLLWFYNFSTACPKDAKGRNCSDVLVEDLAKRFLPGGQLDRFDGLEFDVLHFGPMFALAGGRGTDVNADGVADWGVIDGINIYGVGVYEFCRKLREKMGEDFIIQADGGGPGSQRSFGLLNGIESEGWPHLADHKVEDWSGGLNRHFYWRDHARNPAFNYVNHKFIENIPGQKGMHRGVKTPFSLSRLVLAACMFTDSAVTYSLACPPEEGEKVGIYDELRLGVEEKTNWLGMPAGPPIRLALKSPDLLKGKGTRPDEASRADAGWSSNDATIALSPDGNTIEITGTDKESRRMEWARRGVEIPAGDLFVHFTVKAEPMAGYPADIARLLWVRARDEDDLMESKPQRTGMTLRGKGDAELDRKTGASVGTLAEDEIDGAKRLGYFIHPPWREGALGSVFWEADVIVPEDKPALRFFTGLRKAPSASDGIVFGVVVRAGEESKEVFTYHHTEYTWKNHSVDLGAWKGKEVALRFTADCGPKDNSTADHGCWAEAHFGREGEEWKPRKLHRCMAWAGKDGDNVGFYCRDVEFTSLSLRFEIEGTERVQISNLTIHSHTDAMAREFEHGVVLANPSDHEYTFDLKELFPAKKLRRIKGSANQDPAANNGQPVGDQVTLGPREGLFLVAE